MRINDVKKRIKLLFVFCLFFLISLFSSNGGLEGDQRGLTMSNRIDNWGFIVPFVYGEWPNLLGNWRFTLTLIQILLLWFGMYLIFRNCSFSRLNFILFFIIFVVSSFYAANLYRDATLFTLSVLGFGVFLGTKNRIKFMNNILLVIGLVIISIASMFKPFYSLLLVLVLIQVMQVSGYKLFSKKILLNSALLFTLIILFTFPIDKFLSNMVGMQKFYPQQQPIIMDLAAQYCWGTNVDQVSQSKKLLTPLLKNDYPPQTICASFRPDSWDTLHNNFNPWVYSGPIVRITGDSESKITDLTMGWIKTITSNPIDWIQVRLYFLGPTLFASNSFTSNIVTNYDQNALLHFLGLLWNMLLAPVLVIDKLRLTSLGFSLFLYMLIISLQIYRGNESYAQVLKFSRKMTVPFVTFVATLTVGTLISVANNGRYFMPYILLTHVFTLRSFILNKNRLVKN